MCHRTMPYPTVRSIRPTTTGIIVAGDSIAMADLSDRIARRFNSVGKVVDSSSENSSIRPSVRIASP